MSGEIGRAQGLPIAVAGTKRQRPFLAVEEDEIDADGRRRCGFEDARGLEQESDARGGVVRARHRGIRVILVAIGADDAVVMRAEKDAPRIVRSEPGDEIDEVMRLLAGRRIEILPHGLEAGGAQLALDVSDRL